MSALRLIPSDAIRAPDPNKFFLVTCSFCKETMPIAFNGPWACPKWDANHVGRWVFVAVSGPFEVQP